MRFGRDAEALGPAEAYAALERFAQRYGRIPLLLLIHVAVPQGFRADLLNLIKVNFVLEAGDDLTVDVDVLFSPFVESLGSGYYRLDEEVRHQCLILLDSVHREESERRSMAVARFLLAYVSKLARGPEAAEDTLLRDYLSVQSWVAGAFLDPVETAGQFAGALRGVAGANAGARLQISGLGSALSIPLSGYPELIAYAHGLGALASGDRSSAERFFRPFASVGLQIGDVSLPPPAKLLRSRIIVEQAPEHKSPPPPPRAVPVRTEIQIFVSYASMDDTVPPHLPNGKGFVTMLVEHLHKEIKQLGKPEPLFWRHTRMIEAGDQFDPMISEAIGNSSLLLVILSPNWLNRLSCHRELEAFRDRWKSEGELAVRHRIVVVNKRFVDGDKRPSLLQGQEGYSFFAFEGSFESRQQLDFFDRGEVRDERYYTVLNQLSRWLWRQARDLQKPRAVVASAARSDFSGLATVYLAKPASDMRGAYSRLVKELAHGGFTVVPDAESEIPHDASAVGFIDNALASADISVHLLGEIKGYAPDQLEPIVKLQLSRAAVRASGGNDQSSRSASFRRIIWAPKDFTYEDQTARDRDPLAVLMKFDRFLPTDTVAGDSLSRFVDFFVEFVARQIDRKAAAEPAADAAMPDENPKVYLYYAEHNSFAHDLAKALRERTVNVSVPALEGEHAHIVSLHHQLLIECDCFILCWTAESEVWVHANLRELDWRRLRRHRPFVSRSLVIGPPPGARKRVVAQYPPPGIFVADLMSGSFSPAMLDNSLSQLLGDRTAQ